MRYSKTHHAAMRNDVADEPFSAQDITMQQFAANQIRPFCTHQVTETDVPGAVPNGGSVRVLRGFRGHSACCRPPTPMPVDPASTALWLPDMDFRSRASSNFSSSIVPESGSTDFVEGLVRLEAETAADDLLPDLGGAAEDRLDMAEPPEPAIVPESSGLVLPPVKAGSIWSARAAAFARCDLGGDHAPWDRLAAWQLPEPRL